ncbi:hypothetical protein EST38_g8261 [Candolleomyces aberdarensis]|uniref:Uncharacterized protein n=1 Tax=Candolleomyces aberdarensis TaxID=2316362 RepID=A0A4Q2DET9_9AGAR|nr:hypothetical protein EST38_g8261 [Candolleomyces aberdarensis]
MMHRMSSPASRTLHSARMSRSHSRHAHPPFTNLPFIAERLARSDSNHSRPSQSQASRQRYLDRETHAGAEPGVNPRSGAAIAQYSHFKEECIIDVIDYDNQDVTFTRMKNDELVQFLATEQGSLQPDVGKGSEDDMPPLSVRWINIEGIDWNVLSSVALRYNLESLALEDILHESGHNHSKADYYPNHLFLRILCHTLEAPEFPEMKRLSPIDQFEPASTDEPRQNLSSAAERGEHPFDASNMVSRSPSDNSGGLSKVPGVGAASISDLQSLMNKEINHASSDSKGRSEGIDPPPDRSRRNPFSSIKSTIRKRLGALSGYYSLVRPSISIRLQDDPSLLVESLIDLAVDRILEVMDEYQVKISDLERAILIDPNMDVVRSLHILSGDLIMLKRTFEPIKTMIFGLRKYDLDRCIALRDSLAQAKKEQQVRDEKREHAKNKKKGKHGPQQEPPQAATTTTTSGTPIPLVPPTNCEHEHEPEHGQDLQQSMGVDHGLLKSDEQHLRAMATGHGPHVKGYLSYKSKVYLADVYDHMDFALSSLDLFSETTENLINYAFNIASYDMNIVMKRLTLVTIIFLPLTLLTGYFGMNFEPFWSVQENSDLLCVRRVAAVPSSFTLLLIPNPSFNSQLLETRTPDYGLSRAALYDKRHQACI